MAITDLTGTTWLVETVPSGSGSFALNFRSGDGEIEDAFNLVIFTGTSIAYQTESGGEYLWVYRGGAWLDDSYKSIRINGGNDATSSSAISFFETYLTQTTPIPYIAKSTELTSVADAIRAKGGTSSPLVFPDGFVSAIENISGGGGESTLWDDCAMDFLEQRTLPYRKSTAWGAIGYNGNASDPLTVTIPSDGDYLIYWSAGRTGTSGTYGTQLYKNGGTLGSQKTTWGDNYFYLNYEIANGLKAGDVITVSGKCGSSSYKIIAWGLIAVKNIPHTGNV